MEAAPKSALALAAFEAKTETRVAEYGRELCRANMQPLADALPHLGSDGKPLLKGRIVPQCILTRYGPVELNLFSGRCQATKRFEMPFKMRYCHGEKHPVSPLLERRIVTTACETGSYESTSKVCAEWGCEISDDKIMTTLRNVGASCSDSDLPELCEDAATSKDVLIVMMDGWMARFRGEDWGDGTATLDHYHASQHLGVLADALFATDKDPTAKDAWLAQHRRELKTLGPSNLIGALSEIDFKTIRKREAKRIARREVAYFKGREAHPKILSVPSCLRHLRVNRPEALSEARTDHPLTTSKKKIL